MREERIPAPQQAPATNELPSPFPEGWYFIASRAAIEKAGLIEKTWMGEDVVAWADEDGKVCVAEAYCPHLGSYLGPETGGRVCAGRLVCPFHGFEFDTSGQCVDTPFAPPPRSARLGVFETQEIGGLIFAWWGAGGRPAQWRLPTEIGGDDGWSRHSIRTLRFPGHPQETTENSVDLAHLRYVHGYDNVSRGDPVRVDGPYMDASFNFRRRRTLAGIPIFDLSFSASTHIAGLGYSFVDVQERTVPLSMRMWILATPVDGTVIDLSIVSQVRELRDPQRRFIGAGFLPTKLRAPIVNAFLAPQQEQDVLQDVVIWRRKRYRSRPRLCRSDGEIMAYRDYCSQFYPDER